MRKVLLTLALLGMASAAFATPDDLTGGVLAAHYVPEVIFSVDPPTEGWCGAYGPYAISSLAEVNYDAPGDESIVWYVLAAWEGEDKTWCGTEFGFGDYNPYVMTFLDAGACYPATGGLEIPTPGWPGPNQGTAFVVTGDPWMGNYVPVYYFTGATYEYYADVIPIAPDPATGFVGFSNCVAPPQSFELGEGQLGALGIPQGGHPPEFPTPPVWACCIEPGIPPFICQMLTEEDCMLAGGDWLPGQECEPINPCEPTDGACCVGGLCEVLTLEACSLLGGEFLGIGTTCEPNPCPAVCCFAGPPHICEIMLEDDCLAQGGYWHPEWTSCDPNPCTGYTPSENSTWGEIKGMYR